MREVKAKARNIEADIRNLSVGMEEILKLLHHRENP